METFQNWWNTLYFVRQLKFPDFQQKISLPLIAWFYGRFFLFFIDITTHILCQSNVWLRMSAKNWDKSYRWWWSKTRIAFLIFCHEKKLQLCIQPRCVLTRFAVANTASTRQFYYKCWSLLKVKQEPISPSSSSFGLFLIRGRHSRYLHFYDMAFVLRSDALPATNPLFRGKTGPSIFHIKVGASR